MEDSKSKKVWCCWLNKWCWIRLFLVFCIGIILFLGYLVIKQSPPITPTPTNSNNTTTSSNNTGINGTSGNTTA